MNCVALIISLFAGLSTCLGFFAIYVKGEEGNIIASSLSIATGVMISLSIIELLPNASLYLKSYFYSIFGYIFLVLFFIIGFLLSMSSDIFKHQNQLYRLGIISFIVLLLHNIPEGLITYIVSDINVNNGILLALSIALHNIPEGITLAIPMYYSTKSKIKTFVLIFILSLSELIGAFIGILFVDKISNVFLGFIYSIVAGLMIGICWFELIPEIKYYKYSNSKLFIILGIIIIVITHLLF